MVGFPKSRCCELRSDLAWCGMGDMEGLCWVLFVDLCDVSEGRGEDLRWGEVRECIRSVKGSFQVTFKVPAKEE